MAPGHSCHMRAAITGVAGRRRRKRLGCGAGGGSVWVGAMGAADVGFAAPFAGARRAAILQI